MPELHVICWQDTSEPWGWAPATADVPAGDWPRGPFFWNREEAEDALADVRERAARTAVELLREHDQHRHALQTARYEDLKKGNVPGITAPGVSVHVAGQSTRERVRAAVAAAEPEPLMTEEELLATARITVEHNWSIQTYEVPERA